MTEPKFTPGPWKAERRPYDTHFSIGRSHSLDEGHNRLITVWGSYSTVTDNADGSRTHRDIPISSASANAALIAAAPDLYKALEELTRNAALSDDWKAPALAALALARGEI